ncbi:MAG: hypothetical protein ACXVBC_14120, partial [Bdellovibrionota bacterium]
TIAAAIFSGFAAPTLYTNESYPIDTGAAISAAFPWQFTYSTLTPTLAVEVDRQAIYTVGVNNNNPVAFSPYVPQASAALNYNSRQSTALSITPEEGRVLSGGMKGYLDLGVAEPKFLVQDAEYFRLFGHAVLVPQVKALWTAIADPNYIFANAVAAGRAKGSFFNIPNYVGFDLTSVRGYPQQTFIAKSLIQASVDFRFPLFQIFRGYQVLPLFLQQFYGSVFGEATIFPYGEYGTVIASAGVSLKLSLDFLIRIPVVLAVDYQQGFMGAQGGAADIFPSISANFAF